MRISPKASYREVLTDAFEKGYAVGQFNINGLEYVQAIVEVAEEERSPVILGASQGAIRYVGLDYLVAIANAAKMNATVPVILHLDHGPSFEFCMKCVRLGFDSIMIDGSEHPFEKNVAITKQVVDACHAVGVDVEGELGRIGGAEDDVSVEEWEAALADPDEAKRFVEETGVDALAAAVGTAHGHYKGDPQIDFDRMATIREMTNTPLVLHGASGVPDEDIKKAIQRGAAKVNINTDIQDEFTRFVRRTLEDPAIFDSRKYLGPAREGIKEAIRSKIRLFGSNGRY